MDEQDQRPIDPKKGQKTTLKEYKKDVQEPWFSLIKKGTKTVEGRLNKGDLALLKRGDILTFENSGETVNATVTDIIRYNTFEDMLNKETLATTLPGIKSLSDGVNVYRRFYSADQEKVHGVIAIQIKIQS